MVGVALLPEGVETDEILFDAVADLALRQAPFEEDAWLEACLTQRYGACPPSVLEGWHILKNEVYLADTSVSPRESAFCTRPSLTVDMVSSYSLPTFNYDTRRLEGAAACCWRAGRPWPRASPIGWTSSTSSARPG